MGAVISSPFGGARGRRPEPGGVRRPVGPPPLPLRLVAVLAVPLLLYTLVATGQKAIDNYRLNQQAESLRAEVVRLRGENIQLQQDIVAARTDASIETIAREQLGLVKPGDKAVILLPADDGRDAHAGGNPSATAAVPEPPPWRQWLDLFFG